MASISVTGLRETLGRMANVVAAGRAANGPILSVVNTRPYTRPIETGRYLTGPRAGQVARKAGGAWMARDGLRAVLPLIPKELGPALLKGPREVGAAKGRLQQAALREVRQRTPVKSGALRAGWVPSGRIGGG